MAQDPLHPPAKSRRIVVKLGTNVIMRSDGRVALGLLCSLVESIAALHQLGHQILVVSSGSIGLGMERLGLTTRPTDLAHIQACAATGQSRLMAIYEDAFDQLGCRTAQVLLTEDDFRSPTRHANLARTLAALLHLGVIPVINENDTVSVAELDTDAPITPDLSQNPVISTEAQRGGETSISSTTEPQAATPTTHNLEPATPSSREKLFGDNDKLSALVATHIAADLLILLSDVDGLYDRSPTDPAAHLLREVPAITPEILALAHGGNGRGRGGMLSKLEAARIAQTANIPVVIANGRTPQILDRLAANDPTTGTHFPPSPATTP